MKTKRSFNRRFLSMALNMTSQKKTFKPLILLDGCEVSPLARKASFANELARLRDHAFASTALPVDRSDSEL